MHSSQQAAYLVIGEGVHFSHMWKTLAWLHHFTKRGGGLCSLNQFNPAMPLFIGVWTKSGERAVMYLSHVGGDINLPLFLRFSDYILGLFWRCGIIIFFSFYIKLSMVIFQNYLGVIGTLTLISGFVSSPSHVPLGKSSANKTRCCMLRRAENTLTRSFVSRTVNRK